MQLPLLYEKFQATPLAQVGLMAGRQSADEMLLSSGIFKIIIILDKTLQFYQHSERYSAL